MSLSGEPVPVLPIVAALISVSTEARPANGRRRISRSINTAAAPSAGLRFVPSNSASCTRADRISKYTPVVAPDGRQ